MITLFIWVLWFNILSTPRITLLRKIKGNHPTQFRPHKDNRWVSTKGLMTKV